jgi:hypothetical protein
MASKARYGGVIAIAIAAMVATLTACSEGPTPRREDIDTATRHPPPDAGRAPTDLRPAFDWALDKTACSGWATYWYSTGRADRDGDGIQAQWSQRCTDGKVQTSPLLDRTSGRDDCDDTDPSRSIAVWRDADGDQFAPVRAWEQCVGQVPSGYTDSITSVPVADCDDNDPLVQEALHVDADGDGFGTKDETRCAPFLPYDEPTPPGLTRNDTDCDDHDARRHPYGFEQWNDGLDSNCDGRDQPLDCTGHPPWCGCALLNTPPPAIDDSCPSADLFIAAQVDCTACRAYSVVVIGNRGTVPVRGGFDVVYNSYDGFWDTLSVRTDLGPGEIVPPIVLPEQPAHVTIVSNAPDCNTANNAAMLRAISPPCE